MSCSSHAPTASITGNTLALRALTVQTGSGWVTATFDAPAGQVDLAGVVNDPTAARTIKISVGGGIALTSR